MCKVIFVSYNRDINKAEKEEEKWEREGYLVTETYWNEVDC